MHRFFVGSPSRSVRTPLPPGHDEEADSSPLKRIRNDKVDGNAEIPSWDSFASEGLPFLRTTFGAVAVAPDGRRPANPNRVLESAVTRTSLCREDETP